MILPLMSIGLLGMALAQDAEPPVPTPIRLDLDEVPIRLDVPRDAQGAVAWEWRFFAQSGTELTMSRFQAPPVFVSLGFVDGFQPDLARLDSAYVLHLLQTRLELEGYTFREDFAVRVEPHPILGSALVADLKAVFVPPPTPPLPPPIPAPRPRPRRRRRPRLCRPSRCSRSR